jgi:hypothetical protein
MDDPELPVRVQAVLALTEMVSIHDSGPWHKFLTIEYYN